MCLYHETETNLPNVFVGYCLVMKNSNKTYSPADLVYTLVDKLKINEYKIGIKYEAECIKHKPYYLGFHGFISLSLLLKNYQKFIDTESKFVKLKICKCLFESPIAEGQTFFNVLAFRAKYRTIIEEVKI